MTGFGSRPSTSARERPPWRSARSRAAPWEGPPAVEPRDLAAGRRHGEEVERVGLLAELAERAGVAQVEVGARFLHRLLILGVVDHVLADALLAAALERDDGGPPLEPGGDLAAQALEPVALDLERKPGEEVEGAAHPRDAIAAQERLARPGFEPGDELVEAELLEAAPDRVELGGAVLDERAALADEVERLAQAGVARVEAADDLLEARGGVLVARRGGAHAGSTSAGAAPSAKRSVTRRASCAAAAVGTGSPAPSSTSA